MMWVLVVVIIVVIGGVAVVAAGRGDSMQELPSRGHDMSDFVGTDRTLGADDVRRVKFNLAVRGYRMSEVDALLARVAQQLEAAAGPDKTSEDEEPRDIDE